VQPAIRGQLHGEICNGFYKEYPAGTAATAVPVRHPGAPTGPAGTTIQGGDGGGPRFEYTIAAFAA